MSSSASLSFPVAAGVAGPSRSVAQAWAAPRAADLVLDPWSAPVGPPIAQHLLSPWPAPLATMRIISMPPPAALSALPDLSEWTASLAASTESAIAAINSSTERSAIVTPTPAPPADAPVFADAVRTAGATQTEPSTARLRAKMLAMLAGGAAAVAGVVTLIATAF